MKLGFLTVFWAVAVVLTASPGCSSDTDSGAGTGGGAAGVSGESNLRGGGVGTDGGAASSSGASDLGGEGGADTGIVGVRDRACVEHPTPLRTQGTLVSLPLQPVMAGKPFVFGEENALADGGSVVPLNFRFYISEVELLRGSDEEPIDVDVVTEAGTPEPYGIHLFNAEDADSGTLRVLAPPGQYSGLSFALGIKLSCNQQKPENLGDPLTNISQMTWPHARGFLYLRYEGRNTAADSGGASGASGASSADEIPAAVHMGGNVATERVPHVTVLGPLSIPASGSLERGMSVVMDEIFKGATSNIDVSDFAIGALSAPESVAGERLRRELPQLHVFVLEH
jgi:hypothetical protein